MLDRRGRHRRLVAQVLDRSIASVPLLAERIQHEPRLMPDRRANHHDPLGHVQARDRAALARDWALGQRTTLADRSDKDAILPHLINHAAADALGKLLQHERGIERVPVNRWVNALRVRDDLRNVDRVIGLTHRGETKLHQLGHGLGRPEQNLAARVALVVAAVDDASIEPAPATILNLQRESLFPLAARAVEVEHAAAGQQHDAVAVADGERAIARDGVGILRMAHEYRAAGRRAVRAGERARNDTQDSRPTRRSLDGHDGRSLIGQLNARSIDHPLLSLCKSVPAFMPSRAAQSEAQSSVPL